MAEKPPKVSDEIRAAVVGAGVSRYAIAKQIGVSQALLSRFVNGEAGVSLGVVDRLGELLGLRVVVESPAAVRSVEKKTTGVSSSVRRKPR